MKIDMFFVNNRFIGRGVFRISLQFTSLAPNRARRVNEKHCLNKLGQSARDMSMDDLPDMVNLTTINEMEKRKRKDFVVTFTLALIQLLQVETLEVIFMLLERGFGFHSFEKVFQKD